MCVYIYISFNISHRFSRLKIPCSAYRASPGAGVQVPTQTPRHSVNEWARAPGGGAQGATGPRGSRSLRRVLNMDYEWMMNGLLIDIIFTLQLLNDDGLL